MSKSAAFTLVELLVVIAIVAALTAALGAGLRTSHGAVLHSAQATLANTLATARLRASASGCRVRVLICAEPRDRSRFRRALVVQQETSPGSGDWSLPVSSVSLPSGVAVLPYRGRVTPGFFAAPGEWGIGQSTSSSVSPLHSSALSAMPLTIAVQSSAPESWDFVQFTPRGTMSTGIGDIVLASTRSRPPGSYATGESPVVAEHAENVRGVTISTYGVVSSIDGRDGF